MTTNQFSRSQVPDACTLPTVELPQRLSEFDDLYATAVRSQRRLTPTKLRITLDPEAEERALDLTARESACCSFFSFTFSRAADGLHLDVQVPYSRIEVLDAVSAQVAAASAAGNPGVDQQAPSSVTANAS